MLNFSILNTAYAKYMKMWIHICLETVQTYRVHEWLLKYADIYLFLCSYKYIFRDRIWNFIEGQALEPDLKQLPNPFLCPKKWSAKPNLFYMFDKGMASLPWRQKVVIFTVLLHKYHHLSSLRFKQMQ